MIAKENYPGKKEVEIINAVGLTPSNYYRMKKTVNNYPTLDHCAALCSVYKISEAWLISGRGQMKVLNEKKVTAIELLKEAVRMLDK